MQEKMKNSTGDSHTEEKDYRKLPKRAMYCMYASGTLTGAVLLAIIGAANLFWIFPQNIEMGKWISLALVLLLLAEMMIRPYFLWNRYRYSINEESVDIIEGYLFVKRTIVPIERLHKLQTAKGPFDQIFHVEKVVLTTGGGDVTISFLDEQEAEEIAEQLRRRINEIVIRQRDRI